jgi:hypothetical protein
MINKHELINVNLINKHLDNKLTALILALLITLTALIASDLKASKPTAIVSIGQVEVINESDLEYCTRIATNPNASNASLSACESEF